MDLDELQTVKSRERQTDSLQQLRDSFYTEASEYLQELRDARDQAAELADDPWNDPEVGRLSDEIETAEQTVEAIHKRRVAKIVKNASLAAHGSAVDDSGLTTEEQGMFDQLVADIEANREHVLDKIAGELPADSSPETPQTASVEGASAESSPAAGAAEHTGPDPSTSEGPAPDERTANTPDGPGPRDQSTADPSSRPEAEPPDAPPGGINADDDSTDSEQAVPAADVMNDGGSTQAADPATAGAPADPEAGSGSPPPTDASSSSDRADGVDRRTVRITEEVGEILGVDQREYDLSADDVVTLPEANAKPLLNQDAAQQLD
ncbi:hypothetical protein [Halapricum desulfuricans]|uniref:DNA replication initiation complex subunit, GINS15 family n=1 Tax=Halapricum desulfuricans TaxID=2841257 RepID=A0A897NNR7_9EURY|nr:hypothetical protein [Halapricum desulfuricans]QSG14388.1 DNA replication initiation complex subunit, GINS15 family [Halapricum desulfuricans]